MGPFDFRKITHWKEPILSGTKHSLVAFQNDGVGSWLARSSSKEPAKLILEAAP